MSIEFKWSKNVDPDNCKCFECYADIIRRFKSIGIGLYTTGDQRLIDDIGVFYFENLTSAEQFLFGVEYGREISEND